MYFENRALPSQTNIAMSDLDKIVDFIRTYSGINLEPKKDILDRKIMLFCKSKDIKNLQSLDELMRVDNKLLQDLINLITVNETYFFREFEQLKEVIKFIKQNAQKTRILCAPCASGEEVYSLGILANEKGVSADELEIIGIDINSEIIQSAKKGIYSKRSLHRLNKKLKDEYFICKDEKYEIIQELPYNIDFRVMNIFDSKMRDMGFFDIIFSRNMMIYFDAEYKEKAIEVFYKMLYAKGRLYVGHADLIPSNERLVKNGLNRYYELKTNLSFR